jgi:LacI family gluconate utilization system Gnt-I transcriptional repressor
MNMMKEKNLEKPRAPRSRSVAGQPGKAQMNDVAAAAGVSIATVSRAIHYPDKLAPATLQLIRDTIARMAYVPDLTAGSLASNRSRIIGVIVPTLSNSIFAETVDALSETLMAQDYQLLIGQTGYDQKREAALAEAFLGRRVDGIVLTGVTHGDGVRAHLERAGIPVVETWDVSPHPIDMVAGFDNEKAGAAVAAYLLKKGHRRLAYIGANEERSLKRLKGYSTEVTRRGADAVIPILCDTPATFKQGADGLRSLLDKLAPDTDAIFCGNDSIAAGTVFECIRQAIAVPQRMAVVGFADLPIASATVPGITTVKVEGKKIGACAGHMLLGRLLGKPNQSSSMDLGFQIIERGSA